MSLLSSLVSSVVQDNFLDSLRYSASVRLLRATSSWGIHLAIFILGVCAFPIVLICFLFGGLLVMPILALMQGTRFIASFFGLQFEFPKLWSNFFGKWRPAQQSEGLITQSPAQQIP